MFQEKKPVFRMRPLCAALMVALSVPASAAYAQGETRENSESEQKLPPVSVRAEADDYAAGASSVGAAVPTPIRDLPQSVTVINEAVMESQAVTTLTEALRNTPGITLSAGEGGNIGDSVNIRGYSARTDLFLDGMRDRSQYARETFFLEAVEVLRGPSSMMFGRGSTGGVINQVSKQARLRDHTEVDLSAGTEAYYRATLDVNRKITDSSACRVALLAHTNESTRDVIESERKGVAGSLRFGINTETRVDLTAVIQRRDDIPDYGVPVGIPGGIATEENPGKPVVSDPDSFYGFTDDEFNQDVDVFSLRFEHEFSPALSLINHTQSNRADVHAMPTVSGLSTNPLIASTEFTRNRRERDIEDESLYNQTDVVIRVGEGPVKHTLLAGIELGHDYYENQAYDWGSILNPLLNEPNQTIENPIYGRMPDFVPRSQTTLTDNESETVAFYLNDQADLGEHWKLVAGVRKENFDFSSDASGNTDPALNGHFVKNDEMTSYRVGIIYQPDDMQSYYISSGNSFNPSAEALTLNATNQNVDPEENRSFEIGGKWDLESGLSLTAALFNVEKINARSFDTVSQQSQLDGETRVNGFELGASGNFSENWQIFAAYTYLDGEIVKLTETQTIAGVATPFVRDGNQLANTPEHTASLWLTYDVSGSLEIGGGAVYSSDRILNNANTSVTDGYTRYDATAAWQYHDKYQLRLNLQNLTDEEYFEVASGGRATPAAGATVILTWTADF